MNVNYLESCFRWRLFRDKESLPIWPRYRVEGFWLENVEIEIAGFSTNFLQRFLGLGHIHLAVGNLKSEQLANELFVFKATNSLLRVVEK